MDGDQQKIEYLEKEANRFFNLALTRAHSIEALRTELDIVKGWIGCFSEEQRKTLNADWIVARANAALDKTAPE